MKCAIDKASYDRLMRKLKQAEGIAEDECLQAFDDLARQCLAEINGNVRQGWRDRTGNLFSSIGLVLAKDGVVVRAYGFSGKGAEGKARGRGQAEDYALSGKGIRLAAVAAMPYAVDMEARGVPVLVTVEALMTEGGLREAMAELARRVNERLNA